MIADIMAEYGGRLLVAIGGVGLGLVCLVAALKFYRQRFGGPSPFIRGARSRDPRLQVVDAAAVDTRRRLVLVRRDDVEHLIMIGGPTDIVIESNISAGAVEPAFVPAPLRPAPFTPESFAPAEPERMPDPVAVPAPSPVRQPARPMPAQHMEETPRTPARPTRPPVEAAEKPLERPLPVTPQAAYFEASDDFTAPPAPTPARKSALSARPAPTESEAAALREAEEQLEAVKRRLMAQDTTQYARARPDAGKPSGFKKILKDEMKAPLRETSRPVPPAIQQMTRREPAVAPPAPAENPSLQDEIARIFGEKR